MPLFVVALTSGTAALGQSQPASAPQARLTADPRPVLYVSFTMDCERIESECMAGGPPTWELSEKAIRGYCQTLLDARIRPTLFIVPECGQQHASAFRELAQRGVELGMHLHPQCFQDHRYSKYLGEYDAATQQELIGRAAGILKDALGVEPKAFRGGNFSASDDTFAVLDALGFRHGSISDPGRDAPQYHAVWKGTVVDPHWAHARDRLKPGQLRFLEVPLTTDPQRRHPNGFPYELRIESGEFERWHRPIIEAALARMEADRPRLRVLSIFTHNYFDYSNPEAVQSRTLQGYIAYIKQLRRRFRVVGATLADIRDAFVAAEKERPS
ncbi:MAG: hypothetical protein AMXMBFR13_13530 [Phycisphaerae bacterium]